jgi:polysaccharide pyruvyl transferase WcaK-like protein
MPAGKGNLGDEALLASAIQNVRLRVPDAEILALTGNPGDTRTRHGVDAISTGAGPALAAGGRSGPAPPKNGSLRSGLKRIPGLPAVVRIARAPIRGAVNVAREVGALAHALDRLRGTRLLVVPGSGVLSDHFGGPMNLPYTLWKWCVAARLAGARIVFLSMGAGPLDSRLSRWFVKRSLNWSDYRSLRDESSKRIVDRMGVRAPTPLYPDLAHSLRLPSVPRRAADGPAREIGVNPFPQYDPRYWPVQDAGSYRLYLDRLAAFCVTLLRRGARLHLFPTQLRSDTPVVAELRDAIVRAMPEAGERVLVPRVETIEDLTAVLDGVDLVVATRFHGILLALMRARPVLAVSNHHKMTELMVAAGQADYVLPIDGLDPQILLERFVALEAARASIEAALGQRMAEFDRRLAEQYDAALSSLREARA